MVTTDGGNQVAITCISVGVVLMQFTAIIACSFHAIKKLNTGANQAAKNEVVRKHHSERGMLAAPSDQLIHYM